MTIAWVFPGQGSQKPGMSDHVINLPGAKERFDLASQILGRDLLEICGVDGCASNPSSDLNDTRNTQPALFVVESLLIDELKRQGRKPAFLAGHSLGEFVALYAAEVFDAKTALVLLQNRSELMAAAGGGAMTAVMGFDRGRLESLVGAAQDVVIANDNSSAQVVLSGSLQAVEELVNQLSCKRAIPLQVSGAFHSPFMSDAAKEFELLLDSVHFQDASIPVLSNSEPSPTGESTLLKNRLKMQMTSGVRWRETMDVLVAEGVNTLVEIGPGNVLSGLAKRSLKGITISQIATSIDLGC